MSVLDRSLRDVLDRRRRNAALCWAFVLFLSGMAVASFLDGSLLWTGFTLALVCLAVVPAIAFRAPDAMVPWEVLALASVPVIGRAVVVGQTFGGIPLSGRVTAYVAVAAVALIVAVELDVFTPVRMDVTFAIAFVVVATVATAGIWAEAKWLSDLFLGTSLMLDGRPERVVETALMWDFVAATVAGGLAGVLFEYYFRRRADAESRLPGHIVERRPPEEAE